ncbi:amino acid permease [Paradonghicola geojensis]|nr:amino acid permease [Marivivens geojensis]
MLKKFSQRKPFPQNIIKDSGNLVRNISLLQLTLMGVGSTLGTGIFFALAETVPIAGPGVILSFVIAGVVAALTALCYAEVSSSLPISGSAYTFTYMTLGQGAAMIVAACLLLEWGISAAAVSVGWSNYLNDLISYALGYEIPEIIRSAPFIEADGRWKLSNENYFNLPAVVLVWMCASLLLKGSQESVLANSILTFTKLAVLTMFIAMSLIAFNEQNLEPFAPFGLGGIGAAAAIVFFSFIGIDAVVNASEEAQNPTRNIPLAIIAALIIVTVVYVLVAVGSLGVQPSTEFNSSTGNLSRILEKATGKPWLGGILAAGAVVSIFSVTLIALYGQSRIFFAMARDNMIPSFFGRIDPKNHVPRGGILSSAFIVTPMAAFLPSQLLWSIVSLGTLVTFISVAVSLILLRSYFRRKPTGYKTPLYPVVPLLAILSCVYLLSSLSAKVYVVFAVWVSLVMLVYFFYSRKHAQAS